MYKKTAVKTRKSVLVLLPPSLGLPMWSGYVCRQPRDLLDVPSTHPSSKSYPTYISQYSKRAYLSKHTRWLCASGSAGARTTSRVSHPGQWNFVFWAPYRLSSLCTNQSTYNIVHEGEEQVRSPDWFSRSYLSEQEEGPGASEPTGTLPPIGIYLAEGPSRCTYLPPV